jgi:hypothetical protein
MKFSIPVIKGYADLASVQVQYILIDDSCILIDGTQMKIAINQV